MGALDGRVAVITGAGRGIGREHALLFAAEGAAVVVNDRGGAPDDGGAGAGDGGSAAERVVAEITAAGGRAVANDEDVAHWDGGRRLVEAAIEAFGDLHVLVNNAGILRDRSLCNMTEEEWDDVIRVHLKGHFVPTHFAGQWWREQHRAGVEVDRSVINTSSTSGLLGNPGQTNYGAAKAGIGAFTVIAAQELRPYGVRVNAIAPAARTRLTESTPGLGDLVQPPPEPNAFDLWDAANVSPLVAYLASASARETGATFFVQGGTVRLFEPWQLGAAIEREGRWTVAELAERMPSLQPGAG
ncbi:MAG: SDR family oxidoreductase [Actinomycetota bacterium]|nr:SDR family oxidoreductase [Actinomycetota bacterium]